MCIRDRDYANSYLAAIRFRTFNNSIWPKIYVQSKIILKYFINLLDVSSCYVLLKLQQYNIRIETVMGEDRGDDPERNEKLLTETWQIEKERTSWK